MQYFKEIPKLYYNFDIKGKSRLLIVKDVALNVRFVKELTENIQFFDEYVIKDGETPEHVSEAFYNSPYYHWIIMLYNQKYDYINDWPRSSLELGEYIREKYGENNEYAQHEIHGNPHYEDRNGNVYYHVDPVTGANISEELPFWRKISNTEYEERINEEKRHIRILDKRLVDQVVNEFESAFSVISYDR